MITESTIAKLDNKVAAFIKESVSRFGQGVPQSYINMFMMGAGGTADIYNEEMQEQIKIDERRKKVMESKGKGHGKNKGGKKK